MDDNQILLRPEFIDDTLFNTERSGISYFHGHLTDILDEIQINGKSVILLQMLRMNYFYILYYISDHLASGDPLEPSRLDLLKIKSLARLVYLPSSLGGR